MNRSRLFCSILAFGLLALAVTPPADAESYTFVQTWRLLRDLDKWVDKKVTFTDKLAIVYPKARKGHTMFDTESFRCAIPEAQTEGVSYLKDLHAKAVKAYGDLRKELEGAKTDIDRTKVVWKIYKRFKNKPIVTVFGTVERKKLWGKVDGDAEGAGVVSEHIVIVVDRVEKPRARWYEEIK